MQRRLSWRVRWALHAGFETDGVQVSSGSFYGRFAQFERLEMLAAVLRRAESDGSRLGLKCFGTMLQVDDEGGLQSSETRGTCSSTERAGVAQG
ncbi:MAG: hypothetical protein JWR10_1745 [Rubritepida sp.]|nr:hypothetical protein [Rubritepida sp.]